MYMSTMHQLKVLQAMKRKNIRNKLMKNWNMYVVSPVTSPRMDRGSR